MAATRDEATPLKGPSALGKVYLLVYNGVLTAGWFVLLLRALQYVAAHREEIGGRVPGFYDDIRWLLLVFQTAALLEVVHSAVGLVSSGVMTTLAQVYSRVFITWAIVEGVAGTSEGVGLLVVCFAWSLTEVVRYSYYFFNLLGGVPYLITWLRYTMFFVLYPLGVLGEMMLYFSALPVIKAKQQWSVPLPNCANMAFNFYYILLVTIILYIPVFPQLYGHMISQRKKIIGGKPKTD